MMKKRMLLPALAAVLALTACGGTSAPTPEEPDLMARITEENAMEHQLESWGSLTYDSLIASADGSSYEMETYVSREGHYQQLKGGYLMGCRDGVIFGYVPSMDLTHRDFYLDGAASSFTDPLTVYYYQADEAEQVQSTEKLNEKQLLVTTGATEADEYFAMQAAAYGIPTEELKTLETQYTLDAASCAIEKIETYLYLKDGSRVLAGSTEIHRGQEPTALFEETAARVFDESNLRTVTLIPGYGTSEEHTLELTCPKGVLLAPYFPVSYEPFADKDCTTYADLPQADYLSGTYIEPPVDPTFSQDLTIYLRPLEE